MKFGFPYLAIVIGGLAGIAWGLPAAHRLKSPLDILAALVVLAGMAGLVLGALLTTVPGFFR